MFNKFFRKKKKEDIGNKGILLTALLIHAAKIDENYTNAEKEIIKKAIINLNITESDKVEELIKQAEKKEQDSNQIIDFTKEIDISIHLDRITQPLFRI